MAFKKPLRGDDAVIADSFYVRLASKEFIQLKIRAMLQRSSSKRAYLTPRFWSLAVVLFGLFIFLFQKLVAQRDEAIQESPRRRRRISVVTLHPVLLLDAKFYKMIQ